MSETKTICQLRTSLLLAMQKMFILRSIKKYFYWKAFTYFISSAVSGTNMDSCENCREPM